MSRCIEEVELANCDICGKLMEDGGTTACYNTGWSGDGGNTVAVCLECEVPTQAFGKGAVGAHSKLDLFCTKCHTDMPRGADGYSMPTAVVLTDVLGPYGYYCNISGCGGKVMARQQYEDGSVRVYNPINKDVSELLVTSGVKSAIANAANIAVAGLNDSLESGNRDKIMWAARVASNKLDVLLDVAEELGLESLADQLFRGGNLARSVLGVSKSINSSRIRKVESIK
jgi:hypothetical protein